MKRKDGLPKIHAEMTHSEIGKVLGVSRTRISQIEARAMRKMRKRLKAKGIGPADLDELVEGLGYA